MPDIISIDPLDIAPSSIEKAVTILEAGGVVAFPTETFYGLAADAMNEKAVDRIFEIKGRSFNNPIALIISREDDLDLLTDNIPAAAKRLMAAFWPGPLTIVFQASPSVSPRLTAGTGKIGVRISSHPIAHALATGMGRPITATSANLSGGKECTTADEVRGQMANGQFTVIDGGPTPGGRGSTFLDVTLYPPALLREGAIHGAAIRVALKK
ncbi:MAG: L-threonylcarbamoyladenylate synthase [Syntrophus sp. (in: bacteria)]